MFDKADTLDPDESVSMTYPDGSIAETGNIELIPEFSVLASSPVRQVRSYWNSGVVNLGFTSDFATPSGEYDHIISSHSESASIIGGTLQEDDLNVVRSTETSSRRAYSRYKIKYDAIGGWIGANFSLYFHVGNNTYETTISLKDVK